MQVRSIPTRRHSRNMAEVKKCTHVIFDLDGLMLDTEKVYTDVTQDIISPYGKTFEWSVKVKLMGMPEYEAARTLVHELQLPLEAEEVHQRINTETFKQFPFVPLMPGVEKLVHHLHAHGIPMAIATGSSNAAYNQKVTNKIELFSLISHVVKSDDPEINHGKPAPDIFQVAASRFENPPTSPDHVLVFEDAPNGVEAAVAAEMPVVMVPNTNVDRALCSKASLVLNSLEEFDPAVWGLPGFQNYPFRNRLDMQALYNC